MTKKLLVILNTLSIIAVIIINYLAAMGGINNQTIAEVSRRYETLFTPAGYAFSIWVLIYFGLISFTGFQWFSIVKQRNLEVIEKTALFFLTANLANIGWIFLWLYDYIGLSVIAMVILLLCLIKIIQRLDMEMWDAPVRIISFVWWPFAIYFGWIITALTANVAAYLTFLRWDGSPLNPDAWAVALIIISTIIYILLIAKRNLRETAAVGVWALLAIAIKHGFNKLEITITAITAATILIIIILYHGYKNVETSPIKKLMRGEF
jgi:hypothetical protein